MLFSTVLMLFLIIGAVSAMDSSYSNENTEDISVISQELGDSIDSSFETDLNDNEFLGLDFDDNLQKDMKQSTLSGNDTELYYKNGTSFKVLLSDVEGSPLANQKVIFTVNDVNYTRTTNNDGIASIEINLKSGCYLISSFYNGNADYSSFSTENTVNVLPTINGKDIEKYYKNDTQYYATFFDGQGRNLKDSEITFNINGVFYQRKTNENGLAKLNINLNPGEYILTAINPINGEMYSNIITVLPTLSSDDLAMSYRDGHRFAVYAIDDGGDPLENSPVTFNINGVFYTRTSDSNGNAYLNINLDVGEYIITATNYKGLSVSNKIKIAKGPSIIKGDDIHLITGVDRDYCVVLSGLNNKSIPYAAVKFKCNGAYITAVTNENGEATLLISNPPKGEYTIEYEFEGNLNYLPYKSSSTLIVEDSTNILEGKDLKMTYQDGSEFKARLTDLNSIPLAGETITFNLNGKVYDRITDANGVASLKIGLNPGTYEISYSYCDIDDVNYNQNSNTITVSKIPAYLYTEDLAFDYEETESFKAVLTDSSKNPLEGIGVTFTICGRSYNRVTDANGVAKLGINLQVGYYDITTSLDNTFYTAGRKSNHVLVDGTILVGNDLALIACLTRAYSVTLLDAYRNPISNADIEFNYNGITKHAKTNAQGAATINIGGLAKGDYPIVYTHTESGNSGQSSVHVSQSVLNRKNTISDLGPYLAATRNCQVSNSEIVSLARQLTEGLSTPLDKAIAIFNYVRDTISYSYYYDTKFGAVETMHAKRGNCVDQSHLAIALYRAAGLPARYVHGSCTFTDGDVSGHVWTQVLIEDTWVVGDPINLRNSLGNVVNWNNNYYHKGYYSSLPF